MITSLTRPEIETIHRMHAKGAKAGAIATEITRMRPRGSPACSVQTVRAHLGSVPPSRKKTSQLFRDLCRIWRELRDQGVRPPEYSTDPAVAKVQKERYEAQLQREVLARRKA